MTNIYALTQSIRGKYQTRQVTNRPFNVHGLLSLKEPILEDHQLVFWYPQELPIGTARWLAKEMAVNLKRKLSGYTK